METVNSKSITIPFNAIDDKHISSSVAMILEAAGFAAPGSAALLGCGKCGEIPLRQLAKAFAHLDLVDLNRSALEAVLRQSRRWDDAQYHFHQADLTGLISPLQAKAHEIAAGSIEPPSCLDRFCGLLDSTVPDFWKPPTDEPYQLVVCSLVMTQLQAGVRKGMERAFVERFPEHASELTSYPRWRSSIRDFARRLEHAFILHLGSLCSAKGVIYLSDTVHVCWLIHSASEAFTTEGAWIATLTSRLRDYLCSSDEVMAERRWNWIRKKAEGPYWGRLYGVQALTYRRGRAGSY